jgi:hypothetical protein
VDNGNGNGNYIMERENTQATGVFSVLIDPGSGFSMIPPRAGKV